MKPVLVTGATGAVGATGRHLVELLLKRGAPVRAMVRREDERSKKLADAGAEVLLLRIEAENQEGRRVMQGTAKVKVTQKTAAKGRIKASAAARLRVRPLWRFPL